MIIALTGPTCSGKTTIERELHKLGYGSVASHTTRALRPGEIDGKDYCFVSPVEMQAMIEANELIEFNRFGSTLYGISKVEVLWALANNIAAVVVLDPNGNHNLREWAASRGVSFRGVWVECSVHIQAQRFAARVAQVDGARVESFVADRLALMLGVEHEWRERTGAFCATRYDLRMSSDSLSPQKLASFIDDYRLGLLDSARRQSENQNL
jgi:guanylate kinase